MTECWSCGEEWPDSSNYCGECAAPLAPFEPSMGDGFLGRTSLQYLRAVHEEGVDYKTGEPLGEDLAESLQAQLEEDVREGLVHISAVLGIDEMILYRVALEPLLDETFDIDDIPPESSGFIRLLDTTLNNTPEKLLSEFREESED